MRTAVMIAIAAAAGFLLAWLLLTQVPQHEAPAASAKPAAKMSPPAVAVVATPPPAATPPPPVVKTQPPPAPVETPKPAASKEAAVPETAEAPAEEPPADEEEPADEEAGPPPIDADHAADLLADLIARQEAAAGDSASPNGSAASWKTFDQEQADPAWSAPTAEQIEAALNQWLAALPDEIRDHIVIAHIECRSTLCQILAADNDIETQNERAQAGQEWQQAIATLPNQPWWNELGFVDLMTQVTSNEGHTLYITYLKREVKPPPE